MAETDSPRSDPFNDVINLLAAPLAGGLRSYEQFRRGVDEMFRTIENLNTTMENLNETASRVNRLIADVEEPIRAMLPQMTRTIRSADEFLDLVGGPARQMGPSLGRIAETLTSPSFATLPHRLDEFIEVMSEASRRLSPLVQLAESAGGMFGFRIPGLSGSGGTSAAAARAASTPATATTVAEPAPYVSRRSPTTTTTTAKRSGAKKSTAKKTTTARTSAARKATAKKSTARKSTARTSTARKSSAKKSGATNRS